MGDPLLIGFTGPAGVGKSVAAFLLASRGAWDILSFADPIKECVAAGLGISRLEMEAEKRTDPRVRSWLRAVGDHGRMLAPLGYIAIAAKRWRKSRASGVPAAVDDVRLPAEAESIRKQGGVIVHVVRRGVDWSCGHGTEMGIERVPGDVLLRNDGTVTGMQAALAEMMADLQCPRPINGAGRAA